ncbi:MAG: YebG family protein [Cognaticolwellia sp.]
MAVESRFVVIRQGVEVETFMDKKAADEYDKMLDMADNLSEMFEQGPVELSESIREELSVYLAQNREDVLVALQAKKAKVVNNKATAKSESAPKVAEKSSDKAIKEDTEVTKDKAKKPKSTSAKATSKGKAAA